MTDQALKHARTCNNCRALYFGSPPSASCDLGFKFDPDRFVPLEPCPKPRTYREYCAAMRSYANGVKRCQTKS